MFFKDFNNIGTGILASLRSFDYSIYYTGFSRILIYLKFQRASLDPYITLDFSLVNLSTVDFDYWSVLKAMIYTVISTYDYLTSLFIASRIRDMSLQ